MDYYIVRIYRKGKNIPHNLLGVVEGVGIQGKKAFTNLDELWAILNPVKKEPYQSRKARNPKKRENN